MSRPLVLDLSRHFAQREQAIVNVYIDAPTYAPNSNGIRCLYYLARRLADQGVKTAYLPRSITGFSRKLPADCSHVEVVPSWSIKAPGILICAESIPGKIVKQARKRGLKILWWYLAPYGLLEKPKAIPKAGDIILPFSSFVLPEDGQFTFFQPPLDHNWGKALATHRPKSDHKRVKIGLYCGKGRLRALPANILRLLFNSDIVVITRSSPSCRGDLFKLIADIDGLITFDELSQIALECTTMGVPVLRANPLFPLETINLFTAPIRNLLTEDARFFIELVHLRRQGKIKPVLLSAILSQNEKSISQILRIISSGSWGRSDQDERIKLDKMIAFGRQLRATQSLYPHYDGQSAGSFLFGFYLASLRQDPFRHKISCFIISLVDEIGKLAFVMGGGSLFTALVTRLKKSKKMRKRLASL